MAERHSDAKTSKSFLLSMTCISALIIGAMLYEIIATPDEGGIWDGYVPTWLGGEGAPQ